MVGLYPEPSSMDTEIKVVFLQAPFQIQLLTLRSEIKLTDKYRYEVVWPERMWTVAA